MELLIIFSLYIVINYKKKSISIILAFIIIATLIFGVLIGRSIDYKYPIDYANQLFTVSVMLIFIHSFKNFGSIKQINIPDNNKSIRSILIILKYIGLFALVINTYIVYKAFGLLLADAVNIQEYKNEGGASDLLTFWVNPNILMLSRLASPIGYIALPFHFYFLIKREIRKSLLFFFISLNIPLNGLQGLSRSSTVLFLLLYSMFYLITYTTLTKELKRTITKIAIISLIIVTIPFAIITTNRFSEHYNVAFDSKIQNTALYSVMDYASQWNHNGIEVLREYSSDKIMYGKSSTTSITMLTQRLGIESRRYTDVRKESMGMYATWFTGLVSTLVYDMGYFLTLIFSLTYFIIVRKISPRNGIVSINHLIWFGLLIPIPLMFFGNNQLSNLTYNLAIIYGVGFSFILKIKR